MRELVDPQDPWNMAALPISFIPWEKRPVAKTSAQLCTIGKLLKSARSVIHAGDPDDEGQLIVDEILQWAGSRLPRSEERRVGKEGVSTCRSRWSPYH